jgi:ADP-heptose:LPS heptosyltransferase/ubiquinone/menaquinone biosynthesis C-methylase UbiE
MPKIKLIREYGSHGLGDKSFDAGKIYEVDYATANYMVNYAKVAVEIKEEPKVPVPPPQNLLSPKDDQIKIALLRLGGIGDSFILSGLAVAIRRKYPNCHITAYVRDVAGREILTDNPNIDHPIAIGNKYLAQFAEEILLKKDYDIIYDSRYMTKVYYRGERFNDDKKITDKLFKPYEDLFKEFPFRNNVLWNKFKTNSYDLMLTTTNLKGTPDDLFIEVNEEDRSLLTLLENDRYVTIHNGADIARQTKCWLANYWIETVKFLKKKGYKVILLGNNLEEPIPGAIDMRGKTNLKQTAALLSAAQFHIDSEGGLVHMARAMRTRSIVLFGPTSYEFFKYDENVNVITPNECKDCWWTTDMWWRECPKNYPNPVPCMAAITPEIVGKAIKKMEALPPLEKIKKKEAPKFDHNEDFAEKCILDTLHYESNPWQLDRVSVMMAKAVGKKVLEVGAADGYCCEVLTKRGFDVTGLEISKIRYERMKAKGIKCILGDVNALPFPDNEFDTVICGEVLEHIDSMGQGMKELERVCKPDGKIIISLPVGQEFKAVKMHKWGIDHHSILRDGKLNMVVLELTRINKE